MFLEPILFLIKELNGAKTIYEKAKIANINETCKLVTSSPSGSHSYSSQRIGKKVSRFNITMQALHKAKRQETTILLFSESDKSSNPENYLSLDFLEFSIRSTAGFFSLF